MQGHRRAALRQELTLAAVPRPLPNCLDKTDKLCKYFPNVCRTLVIGSRTQTVALLCPRSLVRPAAVSVCHPHTELGRFRHIPRRQRNDVSCRARVSFVFRAPALYRHLPRDRCFSFVVLRLAGRLQCRARMGKLADGSRIHRPALEIHTLESRAPPSHDMIWLPPRYRI